MKIACVIFITIFLEKISAGFQAEDPDCFLKVTHELWAVTAVTKGGLTMNLTRLFILPQ